MRMTAVEALPGQGLPANQLPLPPQASRAEARLRADCKRGRDFRSTHGSPPAIYLLNDVQLEI